MGRLQSSSKSKKHGIDPTLATVIDIITNDLVRNVIPDGRSSEKKTIEFKDSLELKSISFGWDQLNVSVACQRYYK